MPPVDPPSGFRASDDERQHREAGLDETLADSFPASDPPSTDPNPAARTVAGDEPPSRRVPRRGLTIALASAAGVVAAMLVGKRRRARRRSNGDAGRAGGDRRGRR
jgi:hypothetical protein